jgi:hypothetical protein
MGEILSVAGHLAGVVARKVGLVDLFVGFRTGADVPPAEEEAGDGWLEVVAQVMQGLPMVLEVIKQAQAGSAAGAASAAASAAAGTAGGAAGDGPGLHAVPDAFNDEIKIRWSTTGVGPSATAVYEPLDLRAEGPNLRTVLRDLANQLDVLSSKAGADPAVRAAPATPAA